MTNMRMSIAFCLASISLFASDKAALVKPIDVFSVTTLAADGPGSLRRAIDAPGPRLIVFQVGGVIDLAGVSLVARNPEVTIAGQTAPDPGITIIRGELSVETHDVVVQHIAVRPGTRAGGAPDAIGARGREAYNILFDHCSATWG